MKKRRMTRMLIVTAIIVIYIFGVATIYAEGLLPSLSDTVGIAMPSLGEALQRYPDSETENDDGSVTELYINVSETEFNTFSIYLEQQGAELADYHVEGSILTAEIRAKGASFNLNYDSKSGEAKMIYPSGTFDEWMKNAKTRFPLIERYLAEGKYDDAYSELAEIPQYMNYKPIEKLMQNESNLAGTTAAARRAKTKPFATVGGIVKFGQYEQDDNKDNGLEEIEWIVLDNQGERSLLISKYGLDCRKYNYSDKDMTWEECTLRKWLNEDFFQMAFSPEEQSAILVTEVDNSKSQSYEWGVKRQPKSGNNTQDQLFLLSYAEANKYFGISYDDNITSRVAPTAYAKMQGADVSDIHFTEEGLPSGIWWLRSPGAYQNQAATVLWPGTLSNAYVYSKRAVVRPAFWLNLDADIF